MWCLSLCSLKCLQMLHAEDLDKSSWIVGDGIEDLRSTKHLTQDSLMGSQNATKVMKHEVQSTGNRSDKMTDI